MKTTPSRAYRPELDILRFSAFLLVFFHHIVPRTPADYTNAMGETARQMFSAAANMCGFGLNLFFVISGFLITELLLREKAATAVVHLKSFYIRRVLRIWPLYFYCIGLGFLYFALHPASSDAVMLSMYLVMLGNWYFYYGDWSSNPMTPLWSISIEEQFYIFWPLIIKYADRQVIYGSCFVLFLVAVVVEAWLGHTHRAVDTTIWTNSFIQFQNFAAGSALALYLDGRAPALDNRARLLLVVVGLGLWFVSIYGFSTKSGGDATCALDLVLGFCAALTGSLLLFVSILGAPVGRHAMLIYLGKISFGLYAFHLMFIGLAQKAATLVPSALGPNVMGALLAILSIVPTIWMAGVSYRCLETPFLRLKERFTLVPSRQV